MEELLKYCNSYTCFTSIVGNSISYLLDYLVAAVVIAITVVRTIPY